MAIVIYQQGTDGYSGCSDTWLNTNGGGADADTNYDTDTTLSLSSQYEPWTCYIAIKFDVSALVGVTVSSAVMSLYNPTHNGYSGTLSAYRIFKPWTATGITWNDWITPNLEWGTAGCKNASDAGSDNNSDGSGYDRKATAEATATKAAWDGASWKNFTITSIVQAWIDGDINNNGLLICMGAGEGGDPLSSSENATTANRPKLTITYTSNIIPPIYTKEILASLPTGTVDLSTAFTETEYTNVLTDDGNYVNLE